MYAAARKSLKAEWFALLVKQMKEVNGMDDRHVVRSNENLDLEEWRADLEEEYPGYSDDELYEIMCDTNNSYLSDASGMSNRTPCRCHHRACG